MESNDCMLDVDWPVQGPSNPLLLIIDLFASTNDCPSLPRHQGQVFKVHIWYFELLFHCYHTKGVKQPAVNRGAELYHGVSHHV